MPKRISTGSPRRRSLPNSFFSLSPSHPFLKTQLLMLCSTGHARMEQRPHELQSPFFRSSCCFSGLAVSILVMVFLMKISLPASATEIARLLMFQVTSKCVIFYRNRSRSLAIRHIIASRDSTMISTRSGRQSSLNFFVYRSKARIKSD